MTATGRFQFWCGLALIFAIVVGTLLTLLFKSPWVILGGGAGTFALVMIFGGLMCGIPREND